MGFWMANSQTCEQSITADLKKMDLLLSCSPTLPNMQKLETQINKKK